MAWIIARKGASGQNLVGGMQGAVKVGPCAMSAAGQGERRAEMSGEKRFSREEAARILDSLGLSDKYDANEFYMGINVELEHGTVDPATNVSDDDPIMTAKIALAHLNELPNYYTLLEEMEEKGEAMLK